MELSPFVDEATIELVIQSTFDSLSMLLVLVLLHVDTPNNFKVRQLEFIEVKVVKGVGYQFRENFDIFGS
jgi:hypothetical protein